MTDDIVYDVIRDMWAAVLNGTSERCAKLNATKCDMKSEPAAEVAHESLHIESRNFDALVDSWRFLSPPESYEMWRTIYEVKRFKAMKKAMGEHVPIEVEYVRTVHAHWNTIDKSGNVICSSCGSLALGGRSWYCPNCGAKMDEEA